MATQPGPHSREPPAPRRGRRRFGGLLLALLLGSCASAPDRFPLPPSSCGWAPGFDPFEEVEVARVCFFSEGLRIAALLTKPRGRGPFPAYIHNHGSLPRWTATLPLWWSPEELDRALASAGYVVLRPARRGYFGSEGESSTYWQHGVVRRATDVVLGAYEEARDVEAAFDYLSACSFVDPRRIALGGHSVGGVVTVIAAAARPRAAAVVALGAGFTWRWRGVQEGYPAVSAVWRTEAPRLSAPTLVLHAVDDEVVPPELGRELARRLEARGVPVRLELFRGGHLSTPVERIRRFLDQTLKRSEV